MKSNIPKIKGNNTYIIPKIKGNGMSVLIK